MIFSSPAAVARAAAEETAEGLMKHLGVVLSTLKEEDAKGGVWIAATLCLVVAVESIFDEVELVAQSLIAVLLMAPAAVVAGVKLLIKARASLAIGPT
jgi:hypothetical protein